MLLLDTPYSNYTCYYNNVFYHAFQELQSQASGICAKARQPTKPHAKILRQLFPSSSSKRPKLSSAFDPTKPCVASKQQQQKKSVRCKVSKITLILIEDKRRIVPKGKYRKGLEDNGRIKKTEFRRDMTSLQVKNKIKTVFSQFSLFNPSFLTCEEGSTLCLECDGNQNPDGNQVVDSVQSRKGTLYIMESTLVSH